MKYSKILLTLVCLSLTVFFVCSDSTAVSPVSSTGANVSAQKLNLVSGLTTLLLPPGTGTKSASTTVVCSPTATTTLNLSCSYRGLLGLPVTRNAKFTVPAGALNQTTSITMSFDSVDVSVHFEPEGLVFNQPASLDYSSTGLGNLGLTPISFYYIDNAGYGTPMPYVNLSILSLLGQINMKGGQIPHFSKYAFAR